MTARARAAAIAIATALAMTASACGGRSVVTLRYAHMSASDSVAGMQAEFFARRVAELSDGRLAVEVFPASFIGDTAEQLAMARDGTIDIHHTTAGALATLVEGFTVLDTPYRISDPERLSRIVDLRSPLMTRLDGELRHETGLRVLYTFYFGTRHLSFDGPALSPVDLRGAPIRANPYPVYELAVAILGGVPTPVDWNRIQAALATGAARGQENPIETIYSSDLYRWQSHLMLTGHIVGAEIVVMNERSWALLPRRDREALAEAATETGRWASGETLTMEAAKLETLRSLGMRVVGEADGLRTDLFKARAERFLAAEYGERLAPYFALMDETP